MIFRIHWILWPYGSAKMWRKIAVIVKEIWKNRSVENNIPLKTKSNAWSEEKNCGKIHMKNGIVKNNNKYIKILENLNLELAKYNLGIEKIAISPILGGDGNKEFIIVIKRNIKTNINFLAFVRSI